MLSLLGTNLGAKKIFLFVKESHSGCRNVCATSKMLHLAFKDATFCWYYFHECFAACIISKTDVVLNAA